MWTEGQKSLLFGSCNYSHLSHDSIKKQAPSHWQPDWFTAGWSHISSWHDVTLGWDVTSSSIWVRRLVDCSAVSSVSLTEKLKITQTKQSYFNVATQYFANSGYINTLRSVLLQRQFCHMCDPVNSNITWVQTGHCFAVVTANFLSFCVFTLLNICTRFEHWELRS